ncbi:unnamed protein product [Clonostachys chloroleuca]|uniref:Cyanovirin-N domain-containing protein n=1 Tax=Clonostachys chloroleuca TaxID=1926264 RepID=A0AA35PWB5_9HYPO|nr:unnamed protein product [Clonostachys chloroleuca]
MSFHHSASNIRVEEGHILVADLENGESRINLDDFIGNNNGNFEWGGVNFSGSAEDIRFELEGDGQPILRARLGDVEGNLHDRDINLSERIGNDNGNLRFA